MSTREVKFGKSLEDLLLSCEGRCVFDCCGIEAGAFTSAKMRSWMEKQSSQHREAVLEHLKAFIADLVSGPEADVSSSELNTGWTKKNAVAFFTQVKSEYVKAMETFGKP